MISAETIVQAVDSATWQFRQSAEYQELVSEGANLETAREFLRNLFRTHFLSSHAEGSLGTWLLTEDVIFENVAFGLGGRAPLLHNRGLSVTVKEDDLDRLATVKIDLCR